LLIGCERRRIDDSSKILGDNARRSFAMTPRIIAGPRL
jgi:hypothetical protein